MQVVLKRKCLHIRATCLGAGYLRVGYANNFKSSRFVISYGQFGSVYGLTNVSDCKIPQNNAKNTTQYYQHYYRWRNTIVVMIPIVFWFSKWGCTPSISMIYGPICHVFRRIVVNTTVSATYPFPTTTAKTIICDRC